MREGAQPEKTALPVTLASFARTQAALAANP
jgi:hypothetical protein